MQRLENVQGATIAGRDETNNMWSHQKPLVKRSTLAKLCNIRVSLPLWNFVAHVFDVDWWCVEASVAINQTLWKDASWRIKLWLNMQNKNNWPNTWAKIGKSSKPKLKSNLVSSNGRSILLILWHCLFYLHTYSPNSKYYKKINHFPSKGNKLIPPCRMVNWKPNCCKVITEKHGAVRL